MSGYNWAGIINNIRKGSDIDLLQFKDSLSSLQRLKQLKKKKMKFSSTKNLLLGLSCLNKSKMLWCLLFFAFKVALTISGPFIINSIIQNMLDKQKSTVPFSVIVLLIVLYKLIGSLVAIVCDFLYISLGFQYFAYLYWYILNSYHRLFGTFGKKVNIVQYDCNIITNIAYSALTTFFYSIQIIVLQSMLIVYLIDSKPFSVFAIIVSFYLLAQFFASFITYKCNRNYMAHKDSRLDKNITDDNRQLMLKQREKELFANKRFLLTKLVSKLISTLFPLLINIYVFLIADRSTFLEHEYTVLIVINLIRTPIAELMLAMNLSAQIFNSCRRIVALTSRGDNFTSNNLDQRFIQNERKQVSGELVSTEKGNVALAAIVRYFFKNIPLSYFLGLIVSAILLAVSRCYSFFITQHLVGGDCKFYHYIGLGAQIITPLLFYFMLIFSSHIVSSSLFSKLKKQLDYQTLNRISGDIAAIDRTFTINTFEIFSSVVFIVGSYLYSIVSLGVFWIQSVLFVFVVIGIWIAVYYNRFIMRSRREVARKELKMKAKMIKSLIEGQKIKESNQLKKTWRQIFECKEMGLLIQNLYMAIIHLLLLVLSLLLIMIGEYLQIQRVQHSILLMTCLTIDSDISSLFYSAVRLQLSLVSFQRVLNALTS